MNRESTSGSTMNSETSTDTVRLRPDPSNTLQPWQFFVLAGLACATGLTYLVRGQGLTVVLLSSVLIATASIVGLAVLRAVRPLVSPHEDRSVVVGHRTRAALEQEKALALRTIKELEFDRAMGKISDDDFREMSIRLRARAARLIKQLDAGADYRTRIEQDLSKRLGDTGPKATTRSCTQCSTPNDPDARFCKNCGEKLS
jgi:hypothetical protein